MHWGILDANEYGMEEEVGLKFISGYIVRVLVIWTKDYSGTQPRPRVYILMMETGDEAMFVTLACFN